MRNYDLFFEVTNKLKDGMQIVFTKDNIAPYDNFLNLKTYPSMTITFHKRGLWWVDFDDDDEPMLLENCPDSFFESILLNID